MKPEDWSLRVRRGRVRLVAFGVAAALVAAACGGSDDGGDDEAASVEEGVEGATGAIRDVSEQGEPVTGGSITFGLEAETTSWLPGEGQFANSGVSVAYALYDPLIKRSADGELKPYLAESMEPNEDLTEWTLTLRPDIQFHDGTPLDAAALMSNFEQLRADGTQTASAYDGVTMEVVDDLSVRYTLPAPDSAFPAVLTLSPGWPYSPTAAAANGADAGANPVGTGPFVFESWERDNRLVLRRNDNYWQEGLPYLDEIVFRPIPDEDTRMSSLTSGDIDGMMSLRQSNIIELREADGIDNYEQIGNSTGSNIFNTAEPPLDDIRVRRALAMATDQEQVIEVLGGGGVVPPATQIFGPDDPYYSEQVAEDWVDYDPESAQEELQAYVDDPERSDGKAPGDPVAVRYDCLPDASLVEVAQLFQALWSTIGVEVELRQVEQATHINEAIQGDYQVKCWRLGIDGDPAAVMDAYYLEGSPQNFTRFTDPQVTENIEAMKATTDVAERQRLAAEAMSIVNENVVQTYSGGTLGLVAVQDHVKNIDGWTYPDGSEGGTATQGTVVWANVWTTEG
ncbi:MAG TPA: ABC transporter substrate-binding protein [Acidimicrobiales bacterium]|nr:ABC transporter substrate-binding protein [Acidimicrobiales bacterium]